MVETMKTEFRTLYKRTSLGQLQSWQIVVEGNTYYTIEGINQLSQSKPTVCVGKNVGRANETSPEEQALLEAKSLYQKKLDKGYSEGQPQASKYFEPMLAFEREKYEKLLFTVPTYVQPKLDGVRCILKDGKLTSRNGKQIVSCPHLEIPNWFLDGELFYKDNEDTPVEIPFSDGSTFIVSEEDVDYVKQFTWTKMTNGYVSRRTPRPEPTSLYLHREILDAPEGMSVDHINGNKLDNRRSNLRLCNMSQNIANTSVRINSQSGLKGVYYFKRDGTWQAQITVNYKRIHLGYFKTPNEAATAYDKAAKEHFGEFARLNTPEDFNSIISLCKKTKPTPEDLELSKQKIKLWVYDQPGDDVFSVRYANIFIEKSNPFIRLVPTYQVFSLEDIEKYHEQFLSEGFEGTMIRLDLGPYENKRSKQLLKYKNFKDAEFFILDVEEGLGNRSGMAGKLICLLPNGNKVGVSMTGTQDFMAQVLKDKDKVIGKQATVKFFDWTPDGSLRFPTLKHIIGYDYSN